MSNENHDELLAKIKRLEDQLSMIQSQIQSQARRPNDLISQLMELRATYLKGVARATTNLTFRDLFLKDPLNTLKETFDYDCPWELTLKLEDNPDRAPYMNLASGVVMTRPYYGEAITLYIPSRPKAELLKNNNVTLADALAAYYDQNLGLFRNKKKQQLEGSTDTLRPLDDQADWIPLTTSRTLANFAAVEIPRAHHTYRDWASVNTLASQHLRFSLGASAESFFSLAAVMFNAVALSWHNDTFRNLLFESSHESESGSTIKFLEQWLGYKYPWDLDLIVLPDDATYDLHGGTKPTWNLTAPILTLTLPRMSGAVNEFEIRGGNQPAPPPLKNETIFNQQYENVTIMGLALYNTDGPGYPFTCG